MIAKIGYGYPCLREIDLSFHKLQHLGTVNVSVNAILGFHWENSLSAQTNGVRNVSMIDLYILLDQY